MSKIIKLLLILLIVIIFFNKEIVKYYYINKFSNWVERPVKIEKLNFKYSGYIEINKIQILNSSQNYYKNIFEAKKIIIILNTKSLFSDLIVIKNLTIFNPEFFFRYSSN